MSEITYCLDHLRSKVEGQPDWKSKYAEAILDFWRLGPEWSFTVHGYVFKDMDVAGLIERITARSATEGNK